MPGKPKRTPKYRRQGERAFVALDGQRVYLGRFDTPESKSEYHRVIAEWTANSGRLAAPESKLTVVELCDAHRAHAEQFYRQPDGSLSNEYRHFLTVADAMIRLYGRTPAVQFGPLAFKAVRQELLTTKDQRGDKSQPRSRQYVNQLAGRIKRIFRWAVGEELVPPTVLQALQAVPGLQRGRCDAAESDPVTPVADAIVDQTVAHLTPTVAAMVRLQQYTGMRPGELVAMTTGDVDTGGTVWTYTPKHHKTAWRGRSRTVYLGPMAIAVLKPRLKKNLQAFIFSPAQSERERLNARHKARETPKSCGNTPGSNRKRFPKKKPGQGYTTETYAKAVYYGCVQAFGEDTTRHWRPNRLRHTFATRVRREHGLEAAQVLLGHAAADVTQVYAERDAARAVQVIALVG